MNRSPLPPLLHKTAMLAGAILLGLACSRAINLWLDIQDSATNLEHTSHAKSTTKAAVKKMDYRTLENTHLFGQVTQKSQKKVRTKTIKAPETPLKLQLIGVIFYDGTEEGFAIISEPGKPQKTYQLGEKLPGNAQLYAIEKGRIILDRNGRHEALTLKRPDNKSKHTATRSNSPTYSHKSLGRTLPVKQKTKFM